MLSCTVTYSERGRKSYSLYKELFSFKFNFYFNPGHILKMTGTLGAPGSSHELPPLSYYFPYKKYGRDGLSWDVKRKTKAISQQIKMKIFDWQLKTAP